MTFSPKKIFNKIKDKTTGFSKNQIKKSKEIIEDSYGAISLNDIQRDYLRNYLEKNYDRLDKMSSKEIIYEFRLKKFSPREMLELEKMAIEIKRKKEIKK